MKAVTAAGRPVRGAAVYQASAAACLMLVLVASLVASFPAVRQCGGGQRQVLRMSTDSSSTTTTSAGSSVQPAATAAQAAAETAAAKQASPGASPSQPGALDSAGPGIAALRGPGSFTETKSEPFGTKGLDAAWAAAAPDSPAAWAPSAGIPKILHRIYIADANDSKRSNFTYPIAHQRWIQSCQQHYSSRAGWQYMFWDHGAADALISNHFPWFLQFYRHNATKAIEKSDLMRYAIMYKVGGLYLDSDVECWREAGDMLEEWDAVFQATHSGEGVTNAAMAARPGLEVFIKALQLVQQRTVKSKQWLQVIQRTGPDLLADALVAVGVPRTKGMFDKVFRHDDVVYRLYPVGTFVMPCQWWEQECRRRFYRERAAGQVDMRYLVGWHRLVGSWIKGKEDGIGILNTTAELCGGATHTRGNGLPGG